MTQFTPAQNSDGFYIGAHGALYDFAGDAALTLWVDAIAEPLWPWTKNSDDAEAVRDWFNACRDVYGNLPSREHEDQYEMVAAFCEMTENQ